MKTEGRNAVSELLKTEKTVEKILIEKGGQGFLGKIFAEARKKNIRVQFVDRAALDRESVTKHHQGVIAYTTDFEYSDLYDFVGKEESLIVLCDGVEDVHNLGSIIRVAECAGADGVVIPAAKGASVTEDLRGRRRAYRRCESAFRELGDRRAEKERVLDLCARSGRRKHLPRKTHGESRARRRGRRQRR